MNLNTHYLDDTKSCLNFRRIAFRTVWKEGMRRRKTKFTEIMKLVNDGARQTLFFGKCWGRVKVSLFRLGLPRKSLSQTVIFPLTNKKARITSTDTEYSSELIS